MKFETKYPDAGSNTKVEFEYTIVAKSTKLGQCRHCAAMTRWRDAISNVHVCSEECASNMWRELNQNPTFFSPSMGFEAYLGKVKKELLLIEESSSKPKDIIVVVHNQLSYLKKCIQSIFEWTNDFHLYLWDNGSDVETKTYMEDLLNKQSPTKQISLCRSESNTGFIAPNNELVAWGKNDYIILLNSDTQVFEGWDRLLTGFLEANSEFGQVGFWGGHIDAEGRGFGGDYGEYIDYIPGWCFCLRRSLYKEIGLFDDKHLKFAYCEDADLSLRIKEKGLKIYSLHAPLVFHFQNKTIVEVQQKGDIDVQATFEYNHQYIKERWKHYLATERVLLAKSTNRMDSHVNGLSQ